MHGLSTRWGLRWVILGWLCGTLWTCQNDRRSAPQTLFREVPVDQSRLDFSNTLTSSDSFNIIQYLYFYNGGGVAVGDVDNDGWPDLYFTANQGDNALFRNLGGLRFEEVTAQAGVAGMPGWATGVTMADVNADGWLDIYVCRIADYKGIGGHNELFINQQDGTFREEAAAYGLDFRGFGTQAAFFDYDRDGDLDCYLLNHSVHSTENYGSSDLRQRRDPRSGDRLLRNDSGPAGISFVDVTEQAGIYGSRIGYGLGLATGDLNGDGWTDIYVANDFHENDYLYYNRGDGTFRESVERSLAHSSTFSMGTDIADFDNDGRLDLISLDMKPWNETVRKRSVGADPYNIYQFKRSFGYHHQFPRNMLQWNRGNLLGDEASFSEIAQLAGVAATDWSWSPLFCDLDLDGRKDLFISNGIWQRPNDLDYLKYTSNREIQAQASDAELAAHMPAGKVANRVFRNAGGLAFAEASAAWGLGGPGVTNGAAFADLDRDGDLDMVGNNLNAPAGLWENTIDEDRHYLRVRLQGPAGNPFGLGARVRVQTDSLAQVQEVFTTRGFQSAVEPLLTFGLGAYTSIDRLEVRWPDGSTSLLTELSADREVLIAHATAASAEEERTEPWPGPRLFEPVPEGEALSFKHRENYYIDFDSERLLPRMLSRAGPRLATGDVDGDGLEDVYLCGAAGQSGALFRQLPDGTFDRHTLRTSSAREEVDAAFFDADGDGDLDLYIVSGGSQAYQLKAQRRDQLWLNLGAGDFLDASDRLPADMAADGSCVVALDADGDNDQDLFVGSRGVPGFYGLRPESFLLRNDGNGHFEDATEALAPGLRRIGMVTDACRLPGSSGEDLVVVGEWMPVTIWSRRGTSWSERTLAESRGWWHAVHAADIDEDGDTDLLLGNLGWNTELTASREEPLELFVKDFDGNRKPDPILTYYRQGQRYPYHDFDELSAQMPSLKRQADSYAAFSALTFDDLFPASTREDALHHQITTLASGIMRYEDGDWSFEAFPRSMQISPLYGLTVGDVNGDAIPDILAAGNFFQHVPSLGRQAASYGHLLLGQDEGAFRSLEPAVSGLVLPGACRDLALLSTSRGALLLATRNDAAVLGFRVRQ